MGRFLWCGHPDCREAYFSEAGKRPRVCPYCNRVEDWKREPPSYVQEPRGTPPNRLIPYATEITDYDREFFLPRLFISPD
jgi:hypothetical protein